MATVAIISEYNPFHNGHEYQIKKIREELGLDTKIIAIMSGSFTQRGENAIFDKATRAKCAVLGGVNLVLELPFPFCASGAEFFGSAAVKLINSIGGIDYLSFGSECGDIELLEKSAEIMLEDSFISEIKENYSSKENDKVGYPVLCERMLNGRLSEYGKEIKLTANNILAIEYIKALKSTKSQAKPHTVTRIGGGYSEEKFIPGDMQSATAIRNEIKKDVFSALEYIPFLSKDTILNSINCGIGPCEFSKLDYAIITHLRLLPTECPVDFCDKDVGLYNRLKAISLKTHDIQTLVKLTVTKKYTAARVKRAILHSLLGVTSSELKMQPLYTQVLALDDTGRALLRSFEATSEIPILTKPSNTLAMSEMAKEQMEKSVRAESIFTLTMPSPDSRNSALKFTPFVKKDD